LINLIKPKTGVEKGILRSLFIGLTSKKRVIILKINGFKKKIIFVAFLCFIKLIYSFFITGNTLSILSKIKINGLKAYKIQRVKLGVSCYLNVFIRNNREAFQKNIYLIHKLGLRYRISTKNKAISNTIAII
jgi:hypothetical protein